LSKPLSRARAKGFEERRNLLLRLAAGLEVDRRADVDRVSSELLRAPCVRLGYPARDERSGKLCMTLDKLPVEASSAAAASIVEHETFASASNEGLATDAHCCPDLAGRRKLATECSHIFHVFMPMQLDCVEIEEGCEIRKRS
jgi:hypothetical protein